jgi:hypothetical protein
MERRRFVLGVVVALTGVAGFTSAASGQRAAPGRSSDQRPRWGQQAEQEFRLGRGLGPKLMTEEEWKEHHEKLRSLTGEERERYREEVHQKMVERAKEKGIAMPPAARGPGARRRAPSN